MKMKTSHRLPPILRNQSGASAVEFALIAPVFMVVLMGAFDIGHTQYAQSILHGEMTKAGRSSTFETGSGATRQAILDKQVSSAVKKISRQATVTFTRKAFNSYSRAQNPGEPFKDSNLNGICNAGEAFEDSNRNGVWDSDAGVNGQGGAKDVVLYTATVTYPRLFPMAKLLGWPGTVTLSAATTLRNQPFDDQAEPLVGSCT
jgi:Flp pilus assembly protein TadG